jgi:hypothetical protein
MFTSKKVIIPALFFLVLGVLAVKYLSFAINTDFSSSVPIEGPCKSTKRFLLSSHISQINSVNVDSDFPYKLYLDSASICDISSIQQNLEEMNLLFPKSAIKIYGISSNQQVMSQALTNKLQARIQTSFILYNPDSLIQVMQWAEKFNAYSALAPGDSMLYQSVFDYWMNFVSNNLAEHYAKDKSIKNDFSFRYINARCQEKGYGASVTESDTEKVVLYLNEGEWIYLINKFWLSTGAFFKVTVALISVLILFLSLNGLKIISKK